jgi:hypothetical protein
MEYGRQVEPEVIVLEKWHKKRKVKWKIFNKKDAAKLGL